MKVKDILYADLVNNETIVLIRKSDITYTHEDLLASGKWNDDDVWSYREFPVKKFYWYDENQAVIFIDRKTYLMEKLQVKNGSRQVNNGQE